MADPNKTKMNTSLKPPGDKLKVESIEQGAEAKASLVAGDHPSVRIFFDPDQDDPVVYLPKAMIAVLLAAGKFVVILPNGDQATCEVRKAGEGIYEIEIDDGDDHIDLFPGSAVILLPADLWPKFFPD